MNMRAVGDAQGQPGASPADIAGAQQALLAAASRGDEGAFAELYDALAPRVYGMIHRVVRDPAQSEEVTQEVFVEVWRQSARYEPARGTVSTWILTMAHRRAVDRVRAAESSRRRDAAYDVRNAQRPIDETAEAAERTLDRQRVAQALAGLTDVQRSAIELAYFGGYTHHEVAALLELPLGTAKTRIRDGLIRLRDELGTVT